MAGCPGSGGSNPRKFSEKIALHNQKQAEETRAFEQLMTDLTVSRVQFQKIQQLRLSQSRGPYYGGSLPNVNQIANTSAEFQAGFPAGLDSVRSTRHHGLVERVHRDRNRINAPHRRPIDKHGRQVESSPCDAAYLSPPLDTSWRREQQTWTEDKRPGFRLLSQLNRTNSDSALHTSVMNPNLQDSFGGIQNRAPQNNVFSFPPLSSEESLLGVTKPLPKQLWEAKKVQSLTSRPKSCEVPGINVFPSSDQDQDQGPGLGLGLGLGLGQGHYQGLLNSGGSLPDLSNLHFPPPLSTPLDTDEHAGFPNLSGGSSTGNLPAAMMHLGISSSQGLSSSLSNPSIQASLNTCQLHSSLSNPSINSSLRLSNNSPRRRPAPISPLTLSPGSDQRRGKQLSPTMSPSLSPITQGVALDTSSVPREPPPPYPLYQQSQHALDQSRHHQQQQPSSPLQSSVLDFNRSQTNTSTFFNEPFMEPQFSNRNKRLPYQFDQFNLLENAMTSSPANFNPAPSSSLCYSPTAIQGDTLRSNTLYNTCSGGLPNIILTDDSNQSLSKDISAVLSAVPECFDSDGGFPLEDELHIEPLSLDGLSMLSDPDMVLPDPSVEESFRSDRL